MNDNKSNFRKIVDVIIEALIKNRPNEEIVLSKNAEFIISIIIILLSFFLFMILFSKTSKYDKDVIRSSESHSYPILTVEVYENIVNEYGDKATSLVKDYMLNNNNSIPEFDDIATDIIIPDYNVSCSNRVINSDGSVYLSDCFIRGYNSHYNYEYGSIKN